MRRSAWLLSFALIVCLLGIAGPQALAQTGQENYLVEVVEGDPSPAMQVGLVERVGIGPVFGWPGPVLDPRVVWQQIWICRSAGSAEVQGFEVNCTGASFLDFHISDCCIPGDHWQLKGKNWDTHPNTGVTTSPGGVIVYSVPGRVYNYGGTIWNPGNIRSYIECTYLNGVDVFLADAFVSFSSDGMCTVTPDTARRRIDRSP